MPKLRNKMIEDLIKNARLSSSGRKLLTSQQKAFIVDDWESENHGTY